MGQIRHNLACKAWTDRRHFTYCMHYKLYIL